MTAIRTLSKFLLPNLERDMAKSVSQEVSSMDELMLLAPRVFSYQTQGNTSGAFGRTPSRAAPSKLMRVERPVVAKGLFSD
jgi:hypothetical protein